MSDTLKAHGGRIWPTLLVFCLAPTIAIGLTIAVSQHLSRAVSLGEAAGLFIAVAAVVHFSLTRLLTWRSGQRRADAIAWWDWEPLYQGGAEHWRVARRMEQMSDDQYRSYELRYLGSLVCVGLTASLFVPLGGAWTLIPLAVLAAGLLWSYPWPRS